MCIEFGRAPIETDIYLLLCRLPLNTSSFMGVGVGVRIGVRVQIRVLTKKAVTFAPMCRWVEGKIHIFSHINLVSSFSCSCCSCSCFCFCDAMRYHTIQDRIITSY